MSNHLEGDIISPQEAPNGGVIRVERVWQHRHDLEIRSPKPRYRSSALLAIGAGGLVLATVCAFAYGNLPSTNAPVATDAVASYPVGQEKVVPSSTLRDIVDTTPPTMMVSEAATEAVSPAFTVVPTKRPVYAAAKSGGTEAINSVGVIGQAGDVTRYDRCSPRCESRDPLLGGKVVTTAPPLPNTVETRTSEPEDGNRAAEFGTAALNGAGYVLVQTAALPFTTLKLGRDAVVSLSEWD
ncbi:hypothetical protein JZX87_26210 [Agrobacterium sp. Ap1]|uniref:hypothetical protein n=1 Tax=Agrobacterium sp. Ap1 TaxID=2815337 RepID=UPI001A8F6770|nr:hypothetical protein [Agrobacterium sp. Ap1]MBO0144651.1 hypothetical protein [Agrobacterium sp. Ap1]